MFQFLKEYFPQFAALATFFVSLVVLNLGMGDGFLEARQEFDRRNLYQFFEADSFDNDLVLDNYLLSAVVDHEKLSDLHLLNLDRGRLVYIARKDGQAVAVAVPATAQDGFNGKIDLLIAADMFGRISAARVLSIESSSCGQPRKLRGIMTFKRSLLWACAGLCQRAT